MDKVDFVLVGSEAVVESGVSSMQPVATKLPLLQTCEQAILCPSRKVRNLVDPLDLVFYSVSFKFRRLFPLSHTTYRPTTRSTAFPTHLPP